MKVLSVLLTRRTFDDKATNFLLIPGSSVSAIRIKLSGFHSGFPVIAEFHQDRGHQSQQRLLIGKQSRLLVRRFNSLFWRSSMFVVRIRLRCPAGIANTVSPSEMLGVPPGKPIMSGPPYSRPGSRIECECRPADLRP